MRSPGDQSDTLSHDQGGSFFHDNKNNGIWCDVHCGSFTVIGNVVKRNGANGIFDEISQGPATIANNVVKHNNTMHIPSHGGIGITDSKNVNVYGNTVRRNHGFGISARLDHRHIGWPLTGSRSMTTSCTKIPSRGATLRAWFAIRIANAVRARG